jgi:hypothetical protein
VVDNVIQIAFNKDIVVSGADYGPSANVQVRDASGGLIAATIQYDADNRMVNVLPQEPLAPGTTYQVTVGAGLSDVAGRQMGFPFQSTFRTACDLAAAGGFGKLIQQDPDVRDRLGCAAKNENSLTAVEQVFERGHILQRTDNKTIVVTYFDSGQWASFPDTYQANSPEPEVRTPDDLLAPKGALGKVWREQSGVRSRLGWAVGPERPFEGAVQDFRGGTIVWTGPEQWLLRVFYSDGNTLVVPDPNTPPLTADGPAGFSEQGSYTGDCRYPPSGSTCFRFEDAYIWLIYDGIVGREEFGSFQGRKILAAVGQRATYYHVLGTNLVRVVPK